MTDKNVPTLDVATFEDILDELKKRYTGILLVTHRQVTNKSEQADVMRLHFHGGGIMALGLATAAKVDLSQRIIDTGCDEDENEVDDG